MELIFYVYLMKKIHETYDEDNDDEEEGIRTQWFELAVELDEMRCNIDRNFEFANN